MFDFFKTIINFLNTNNVPYMLTGSVAMSIYTLPRSTRDFDFVVALEPKSAKTLINFFQEGYYCSEEAVMDAIQNKGIFNIIDHESGFRADFVVLKSDEFRQTEFNRRHQTLFLDVPIYIVTIEDLIISKLIWIQDLQSAIQMEDIKNLAEVETLNKSYIDFWISKLNLNTFNLV